MPYVKSPKTGRDIVVGGRAYRALQKEGYALPKRGRSAKSPRKSPRKIRSPRRPSPTKSRRGRRRVTSASPRRSPRKIRSPRRPSPMKGEERLPDMMDMLAARLMSQGRMPSTPREANGANGANPKRGRKRKAPVKRRAPRKLRSASPARRRGGKEGKLPNIKQVLKMPVAKGRPLKTTRKALEKKRPGRKAKIARLKAQEARIQEGRGGRTRGWAAAQPQKGLERHELMDQCGEKCFLQPEQEKFPICAALREGQGCKMDCRGVRSALSRAQAWGYPHVSKAAMQIACKKCGRKDCVNA